MNQQHPYIGTRTEALMRFDDRQDARRAIHMVAMAMRSRHCDKPWHRVSMVHAVRARIAFYTGTNGQRPLSVHDII